MSGRFNAMLLQGRLILMRLGLLNAIGFGLCGAALVGAIWAVPSLQAQDRAGWREVENLRALLAKKDKSAAGFPVPQAEQRAADFYDALGESRYAEQQLRTLFAIATKLGIELKQGQYASSLEQVGRYQTYRIVLPVSGSYTRIRQFCEQVLRAVPFASLDEISFKREVASTSEVKATLRITFYLDMP